MCIEYLSLALYCKVGNFGLHIPVSDLTSFFIFQLVLRILQQKTTIIARKIHMQGQLDLNRPAANFGKFGNDTLDTY